MAKNKFYIKERINPQFKKPYYVPKGQMTKKDANKMEESAYGINCVLSYDTEKEYMDAIEKFKLDGFNVH